MLTMFTVPKPFRGHIDVIQRNAIGSWAKMDPSLQIILFGDEYGTEEVARELAVEHAPTIRRNSYGTPLVDDLFYSARERAAYPLLCFINSDIVLLSDFLRAARIVNASDGLMLMVGECLELDLKTSLEFTRSDLEWCLRATLQAYGVTRGPLAIDYFLFSRALYDRIPPFAIGRTRYDNWLIWKALQSRATVIDATGFVQAIHQKHDYSHISGGERQIHRNPEARCNRKLAGIWCATFHVFSVLDATHYLSPEGIRKRSVRCAMIKQLWIRLRLYLKERYH
jgi:hypothetical protein